jgi:hypothetical protein
MKREAAVLLMIASAGCESRSASFPTFREAKDSGLIEKGWIPPELPTDATDIRVRSDLDTNLSEGTYQSKLLVDQTEAGDCRPAATEPTAIQCGTFVFRTENGLRSFSNRGRTP